MSETSATGGGDEYVLGTEAAEAERLGFQHRVWEPVARAAWERAGFGAGQTLLDLGSGPGHTSLSLADVVGPSGRVVARDLSRRFLDDLVVRAAALGVTNVETSAGSVEELDVEPGRFDGAYARWLFSWLQAPEAALEGAFAALRPGGALVLHEYLHWGSLRMMPRGPELDRAVAACLADWAAEGLEVDAGLALPELASGVGFEVRSLRPLLRAGPVGSPVWRWLTGFLRAWLPKLVRRGRFAAEDLERFEAELARREAEGRGHVLAPTMVELVLVRPK